MTLAILQMVLAVGGCHSRREKRKHVQVIVEKLHRHFNVSVVELGQGDDPVEAKLAVAAIGRTRAEVREVLARVADAVAVHPRAELISQTTTELK